MSAIWNKFKKDEKDEKGEQTSGSDVGVKKKKEEKKTGKAKKAKSDIDKARLFEKIIIRPVVSENAMNQQAMGKYVFEVSKTASKSEIAKAVKALYGTEALKVNVIRYDSRMRRFRNNYGMTRQYKKAIVTIGKEQTVDLFTEAK